MTDDNDNDVTPEEGLDALTTVRELNDEVFRGVDDASENIDGVRNTAHDLQNEAERAAEAVENLKDLADDLTSGSRYGSSDTLDEAFEALGRPYDILDGEMQQFFSDIEDALMAVREGETEPAGTVTIGDTTYEVSFTEVEEDEPEGFSLWLSRYVNEKNAITAAEISGMTDVPDHRVNEIVAGGDATEEEIKTILTFLHESGIIAEETFEDAQHVYLDPDDEDDEDDEDLGELFG